jgi:hypothetical protein
MQHYTSHPYANHPKYTSIEIYGSQRTMLLYDITIILDSSESIINYGAEFIVATFHKTTRQAIHIIAVYKLPSSLLMTFLSTLQKLISKSSTICPIIILSDFNVDVLQKKLQKQHIYYNS